MRITFVQYGDYREAVLRFADGREETYYAQKYSVELVGKLTETVEDVCVICVASQPYEADLPTGVRTYGMPLYKGATVQDLVRLVAEQRPTHLVARSPIVPLLKWGLRQAVRVLPLMATSFPKGGLRARFKYRAIASVLNKKQIEWVGNHNINSASDLRRIGVEPAKVIPWDWPSSKRPEDFSEKRLPPGKTDCRLFYAGRVQDTKGVGDCIAALQQLHAGGCEAFLTVAGKGDIDRFRAYAEELGVEGYVEFLGQIPHGRVLQLMHEHDMVLVPSRHSYPEGLPMTIYDAYCSRTPLVASDHPMFQSKVEHGTTALIF